MPNDNEKYEFDKEFTIRTSKNDQNILINNNYDNYFMKTNNNNDNNITFQMNNKKRSNNYILNNHIKKIMQETLNKNRAKNDKKHLNTNKLYNFSPDNNYWKKREIINKERFEKIKQEREQKMFGNVYPIPKINKNSKEIIRRLREELNEKNVEEDQIEDQINRNIPIKTQQSHAYFRKDLNFSFIDNKRSNKLAYNKRRLNTNNIDKNKYIIDLKNSYVNLIKLKNNKKTKSPKQKIIKNKTAINRIMNEKIPDFHKNNLEKIIRLRKSQNEERIKKFQENKKLIEESLNNNSLVTKNFNFTSQIKNYKKLNTSKGNLDIEKENKKSNKNSYISNKISSLSLEKDYKNLNNAKKQSKILYDISNNQSSSNFNSKTNCYKKIKEFYQKQNKTQILSNKRNCNIYNSNTRNMDYVHYTENNYFLNKSKINNNPSLKYINSLIKDNSFANNHNNQFNKVSNNSIYTNYSNSLLGNYQSIYSLNGTIKNKINSFNRYFFEKNKDNNDFYDKNYKNINYKNNQSNNELNVNNLIENKSNDNIYNQLDDETLNKYRYENQKKLKELNRNISKNNKKLLPINKQKQIEESKDYFNNNLNDIIFSRMDNKKLKNILSNQNKKIKNNLDFYNKEYEFNQIKKKMILEQTFGNPFFKNNLASNNSFSYNNRYLNNNNDNNQKIFVHNIKYNYKNDYQKEDTYKGGNIDIFDSFNFQRKYKF